MAGTDHRWATITSDDRRGTVYIAAFLACVYSNLTFFTRCFIRRHVLGPDDVAMSIAQAMSVVQFALLLVSLSAGLGMTFDRLSAAQYTQMASFQFGNQIALFTSLGFSKIATILLTQRLFTRDMKKEWLICQMVIVSVVIWTVSACFLASVGCSPKSMAPREASQICSSIVSRYRTIVVTDAVTDIILVLVPACLCWQLRMSALVKLQILAVFSFRLPVAVFAGIFLRNWIHSLSSDNPGVDRSLAIVFQQAELCLSLISGTIPCLRSFVHSFDTGSGVKAGFGSSNGYGSSGRSNSNVHIHPTSYPLSTTTHNKVRYTIDPHHKPEDDDHDRHSEIRIRSHPLTSIRLDPSSGRKMRVSTAFREQQREPDGDSRDYGKGLFIRKDLEWEVGSDVRRVSDTPGILRLSR